MPDSRYCKKCDRWLPLEHFWFENRAENRRHYWCKECHGAYIKQWVALNPDKRSEASSRYWVSKGYLARALKMYGLTKEALEALVTKQQGLCAICKEPETLLIRGKTRPLHIDHNHTTGQVRGLLCSACNTGLGKFRDDPALLQAASNYLQTTEEEAKSA